MSKFRLGYVNFFITDFERSLTFFRDQLGLTPGTQDAEFGYASFDAGYVQIAFARVDITEQPELVGRHTGIGLIAEDLDLAYEQLSAAGVQFDMLPTDQPWGGRMAMFKDPDGNVFYLDQIADDHP